MSPRLRKVLTQVGSFALAAGLLYLALRGVDLSAVVEALRTADYRWLLPLVAVTLFSHVLRAWRWQVLLDALPASSRAHRVSLGTAFASLMIGYMINYAAPRLGELARAGHLAAHTKRSFSGVFGTVVVERVLDMIVLALFLGGVLVLYAGRLAVFDNLFFAPIREMIVALPVGVLLLVGFVLVVLLGGAGYYLLRRANHPVRRFWNNTARPMLVSFADGLRTLWRARRRGVIVFTTLAMWGCYTVMAYLPLLILHMAGVYDLSLLDAWVLMVLGALGVVVPAPGGTGSYHYITIQALVVLFGVSQAPAATYAVLTHGAQLVLYVAVGALCLLLQGTGLGALRSETRTAQQKLDAE